MSKPYHQENEIELVKHNGVYVQKDSRVGNASAKKPRKVQPLVVRPLINPEQIVTEIAIDFFKIIRKAIFK